MGFLLGGPRPVGPYPYPYNSHPPSTPNPYQQSFGANHPYPNSYNHPFYQTPYQYDPNQFQHYQQSQHYQPYQNGYPYTDQSMQYPNYPYFNQQYPLDSFHHPQRDWDHTQYTSFPQPQWTYTPSPYNDWAVQSGKDIITDNGAN